MRQIFLLYIYIRRKELTLRYVTKIKQFPNHASRTAIDTLPRIHHNYIGPSERRTGLTIASRANTYLSDLQLVLPNISPLPSLDEAPWKLYPRLVYFLLDGKKGDLSLEEIRQTFLSFRDMHKEHQFIYTDGSKSNAGTGAAIIVENLTTLKNRLPRGMYVYLYS